jgi:hypothetical protein
MQQASNLRVANANRVSTDMLRSFWIRAPGGNMTTLREAAQAALDAWDTFSSKQQLLVADAMTDLRAALAAPEPAVKKIPPRKFPDDEPEPTQKPMTEEQIRKLLAKHRSNIEGKKRCDPWYEYLATVRAVERHHGIGPARGE